MEYEDMVPEVQNYGLIGPCQCSVALGGSATSSVDLRHQE